MQRIQNAHIVTGSADKFAAKSLYVGGDPANGTAGTELSAGVIAELNTLNGLTATEGEIDAQCDGTVAGATFELEDAAAGAQVVNIQLTDAGGTAIAHSAVVTIFLSDAETGLGLASAGITTVGIESGGAGTILAALTANKAFSVQSGATGLINLDLADATSGLDAYVVVVLPNGKQVVSGQAIPTPAT